MLQENKMHSTCKVIDIQDRRRGTKLTLETNAYIEYYINGVRFKTFFLLQKNVKIGKCYEIICSSTNPKNIKVYFDKEVDCS